MFRSKTKPPVRFSTEGFQELEVRTFQVASDEGAFGGFVIKKDGAFYAYRNECRHLPVPINYSAASVLNQAKDAFQCHLHGALYVIETGLCTEGPCKGAKLLPLTVRVEGKYLFVSAPSE